MGKGNPHAYIDVTIGNRAGGRVVFELFKDITPKTVENFISFLNGSVGIGQHTKKPLHYKGTKVFRIQQGVNLCVGDIEDKFGHGGESIYGPTFRDENYVRRHTQAGILSMFTPRGRHTGASSFMVTLKACKPFNGRYVAFGQVISGMEIIRAIEKVPTQGDYVPRVDIVIVDCGLQEAGCVESHASSDARINYGRQKPYAERESTKALDILSGKTVQEEAVPLEPEVVEKEEADGLPVEEGDMVFKSDVERRIHELKMKTNKGRLANTNAVLEEKRRFTDPDYEKKKAAKEWKERQEKKAQLEENEETEAVCVPVGKEYLSEPADKVGLRIQREEQKEKSKRCFGWDVFNQDSLLRAHEKNLAQMDFSEDAYNSQAISRGDSFYEGHQSLNAHVFKATEEAKERVAASMQHAAERRQKFSRRRTTLDDEDISGINEQNRHFNKKVQRAFGEYTNEYKQNLERGTAL